MTKRQHPVFDWDRFGEYLQKQIPFGGKSDWLGGLVPGKQIEGYIRKTMDQFLGDSGLNLSAFQPFAESGAETGEIKYNLFETHRCIFVRCDVPADTPLEAIKFLVNRRTLRIELEGKSREITLPQDVNPNRSIARLKDGILEVRMPKLPGTQPFREIPLRD